LAVVGGLLFSQTLTLYVTPVFYLYMDKLRTRGKKEGTTWMEAVEQEEVIEEQEEQELVGAGARRIVPV
jgi:hypothetical protein